MKKGDRITAFDGRPTKDWDTLSDLIRDSAGRTVPIVVERDGKQLTLHAKIATNMVAKKDSGGGYVEGEYIKAGFLGFSSATGVVKQDFGESVTWMGDRVGDAVDSLIALPGKIPALWDAAFGDGPREPDSPMGVVGAARVTGEIATLDIPASQQLAMFVFVLAGFQPLPVPVQHAPAAPARRRAHRGRPVGSRCGGTWPGCCAGPTPVRSTSPS